MANSLVLNGSWTLTNNTIRNVGTIADTITINGANFVANTQNITTASYSPLDTGSLSDIRAAYFVNNDLTASITIAADSAGTNKLAILWPSDTVLWSWSGSNQPLYAKGSTNSGTTVALQYIITEN